MLRSLVVSMVLLFGVTAFGSTTQLDARTVYAGPFDSINQELKTRAAAIARAGKIEQKLDEAFWTLEARTGVDRMQTDFHEIQQYSGTNGRQEFVKYWAVEGKNGEICNAKIVGTAKAVSWGIMICYDLKMNERVFNL